MNKLASFHRSLLRANHDGIAAALKPRDFLVPLFNLFSAHLDVIGYELVELQHFSFHVFVDRLLSKQLRIQPTDLQLIALCQLLHSRHQEVLKSTEVAA